MGLGLPPDRQRPRGDQRYPIVERKRRPCGRDEGAGTVRRPARGRGVERAPRLHPIRPVRRMLRQDDPGTVAGQRGKVRPHTQIKGVLQEMKPDLAAASRAAVLLTGDFNAPSHLDWTNRCGYDTVPWPTSVLPTQAGLRDSFRAVNPVSTLGNTWSPVYRSSPVGYGHDEHKGEPEPQDRIDFVYYAGMLSVADSKTVVGGKPTAVPNHRGNAWPSDHAAVLTTFQVPGR
ncbi:endonuclease/exonuclease/phosphatase family protein [Kibdelosporangium philippinense]|uniref:endonuclease/exonuclease/phosphatase family protein n=1 Tax=Kibdelosporangium philippinense TaxID=211113 RepID=UPI0036093CF0